jgi:1-acyl-sn-glycerol-3-phosphate acyltransferase
VKLIVAMTQLTIWPIVKLLAGLIVQAKAGGNLKFDSRKRYVIAANHQSKLDPLIIVGSLPWAAFWRLLPFRLFIHNDIIDRWYLRLPLRLLGCFPARQHPRLVFGLIQAEKSLLNGETVVIFPEGRVTAPGETEAKKGVAVLASMNDVMILPVLVDVTKRGWLRSYRMVIGQPVKADKWPAAKVMEEIYSMDEIKFAAAKEPTTK